MTDLSHPEPEAGFTLIEALVALSLGVVVVVMVLSTLHIASNGAARAVAATSQAESFARTGAILAGDAQHGLLVRDGSGVVLFDGQTQSLSFPYMARFAVGTPALLRYDLVTIQGGTDLMRAEAVLLAQGATGPFAPAQSIWRAPGKWEFRYLTAAGTWLRDWSEPYLPRAFGLVALDAPQAVELVASFPDLIEVDCALGPGPDCSLAAEVFP
jgi:type II secretory pathway pseudopilin PulG